MKHRLIYRIAAVLILLFDLGHSIGYPWSDPAWGVDLTAMRSTHFDVLGMSRTYWDFYRGFGLFVSVFMLLSAVLAWQLGNLSADAFRSMRATAWLFAACFGAITALSLAYFFVIPIAFAVAIAICLTVAAFLGAPRAAVRS